MGRGDVPTRGSEWFVYLEICVGVIYGIGWFRVPQPTGFLIVLLTLVNSIT